MLTYGKRMHLLVTIQVFNMHAVPCAFDPHIYICDQRMYIYICAEYLSQMCKERLTSMCYVVELQGQYINHYTEVKS